MSVVKLGAAQMLYVRSMGKALRVTAITTTVPEANAYMERHRDEGLVAEFGELCFMANLYDPGLPIPREVP